MDEHSIHDLDILSTVVDEAQELHDVVSLVIYCPDDCTMMLILEDSGEYWLPSFKCPWGRGAANRTTNQIEDIFEVRLKPQKILRICKFWLPGMYPPYINHMVFELIVDAAMKNKIPAKSQKNNLKMHWVSQDQLQEHWINNDLKSPQLLEYYALVKNNSTSAINIPEEYHICGNFLEIDEHAIVTGKTTTVEKMVSFARFSQEVQEALYQEFVDLCFPCAYMGYQSFSKFLLRLRWRKSDIDGYFRAADLYSRHGLSFREFLYFMAVAEPATSHTYEIGDVRCSYIFRFFNTGRDGFLKFNEFVNFMLTIKNENAMMSQVEEEASNIYSTLGMSKSHKLTLSEFQNLVNKIKIEEMSQIFRGPASIIQDIM